MSNVNEIGGCIYLEQHEKYSILYGGIENSIGMKNRANEDAAIMFTSNGLFHIDFRIKSSNFQDNYGESMHIYSIILTNTIYIYIYHSYWVLLTYQLVL